jgi:phosphatidylglycerophosphate synthase
MLSIAYYNNLTGNSFYLNLLVIVLIFIAMMLDCIDGIHARATKQCSKFGEALDHCFDSASTVIFSVVMILLLNPDKYTTYISLVLTSSTYIGQNILFRHKGVLIEPPINGPEAQCLLMVSYFLWSLYFYLGYKNETLNEMLIFIFMISGIIGLLRNLLFFRRKIELYNKQHMITYYRYITLHIMFCFISLFNSVPLKVFLLSYICFCFQTNGLYILYTILYQRSSLDIAHKKLLYESSEYLWFKDNFELYFLNLIVFGIGFLGYNYMVVAYLTFCVFSLLMVVGELQQFKFYLL